MSQLKDHQIFYLCNQKVFGPYKRVKDHIGAKKKTSNKGQIGPRKEGKYKIMKPVMERIRPRRITKRWEVWTGVIFLVE